MAFKIEGNGMCPVFVFAKCCWSVHSKVVRFGKHVHIKQRNNTTPQSPKFASRLCVCPASSASIQCIFRVWYVQYQKEFGCREGKKLVKKIL